MEEKYKTEVLFGNKYYHIEGFLVSEQSAASGIKRNPEQLKAVLEDYWEDGADWGHQICYMGEAS